MLLISQDLKSYLRSLVVFLSCQLVRHPSSKKDPRQAGMTDNQWNRVRYEIVFIILLFTIHCSLFTDYCFAQGETTITSETLEYLEETSTYIAKCSVKITSQDRVIESDEMTYNVQTSDVVATGNVRYDEAETVFTASTMELNIEKETGNVY